MKDAFLAWAQMFFLAVLYMPIQVLLLYMIVRFHTNMVTVSCTGCRGACRTRKARPLGRAAHLLARHAHQLPPRGCLRTLLGPAPHCALAGVPALEETCTLP